MTTERQCLEVSGIPVKVVWKDIKNLHVGVYPPKGRVRVAAPERMDREAVRLAVISRLGWIRRQQRSFQEQVRLSQREMVTGESHYFRGKRYLLDVKEREGVPSVKVLNNKTLRLGVRPGTDREGRERILETWYREQLKALVPPLVRKWEPRVGVDVAEVRIRKMRTKWGTCTREACRIWLNLELIKKPTRCLEYILVHEMVHFHERHHSDLFRDWMDRLLPQWRHERDELNRAPLSHEDWGY